ncbi:DEAD/DEAH box helicase [Chitinophagaceae bacterium MMS25-I14]
MQHNKHITTLIENFGIPSLNAMQEAAYDAILKKKDVLLLSPTGTGKTLGFLMPVYELLKKNKNQEGIQCLILTPSRELALQIEAVWKKMNTGYKVNSFYGGHQMLLEVQSLTEPPSLLIGTPGRIADHLKRGNFDIDNIHTLVLDEFDKSLDLGFHEDMAYIISELKHLKKRVLVSATAAVEIPEFTGVETLETLDFITEHVRSEGLELKVVHSEEKDKVNTLFRLLCSIGSTSAIIFCNHRESVARTSELLKEKGIDNIFFHGGMEQMDRERVLTQFRNGTFNFLVATDLAARGLDIPDVQHIIHYHLPFTHEEFLHRNGRTARMHATGTAYIILHTEEKLPAYIEQEPEELTLPETAELPKASEWVTLYISGGKKDKLGKIDIVGFLSQKGKLEKSDLGLIEVKDHISFVAVKKKKVKETLRLIRDERMKGKKYKIEVSR